jgi:hypothetical protein
MECFFRSAEVFPPSGEVCAFIKFGALYNSVMQLGFLGEFLFSSWAQIIKNYAYHHVQFKL